MADAKFQAQIRAIARKVANLLGHEFPEGGGFVCIVQVGDESAMFSNCPDETVRSMLQDVLKTEQRRGTEN